MIEKRKLLDQEGEQLLPGTLQKLLHLDHGHPPEIGI
jgi:hypothetical protein